MRTFTCLVTFFCALTAFAETTSVTVKKSARPVGGVNTILISGPAAQKMYAGLTEVKEEKVPGSSDKMVRNSQNIQCTKQLGVSKKPLFDCYFDLSNSGNVLSPKFE